LSYFLRKIDLIILIIIAIVAGAITIIDFFNITSISPDYPLFTLFLLSMLAIHLIVSHFSQEDSRKEFSVLLTKIFNELRSSDLKVFNDSIEIETYLGKRMLEARKSICDLTWKAKISEGFSASDRQLSHGYMDKCISEASDRILYREIFIFNDPRRIDKLERRLSENKNGYSCRYFEDDTPIPRLQFVIIDDEEVFFFASSSESTLCSIRNKEFCKVFKSYYEVAWNNAIPIKDGPQICMEQVNKIREMRNKFS